MRPNGKRLTLVVLSMFITLFIFGNFSAWCKDPSKMKVALIMDGPINDGGWNAAAYQGLLRLKEKYRCEIAYSENVMVPDSETALRDYASRGFDLVIGHGFQWGEPALRICEQYPSTWFSITSGEDKAKNVFSVRIRHVEGAYLAAIIAAHLTKTNIIGFVSGYALPNTIALGEAYKLGAQHVNPKIKFISTYVNGWDDIVKAKEAAIAEINTGADIVTDGIAASGSIGIAQGAESQGKLVICRGSTDKNYLAPNAVLTTVISDNAQLVMWQFEKLIKGELEGKVYILGMREGIVSLASFHQFEDKIPQKVKKEVEKLKTDIISGKLEIPYIIKRSY